MMKTKPRPFVPLLIITVMGLLVWFWPPQTYDVSPLVRPPVADPGFGPQTIVSVAQGEPVGREAYFKGFRLNSGWHLAEMANTGHYTLVADVTNVADSPDTAVVLVRIRVADKYVEMLWCRAELEARQTGRMWCNETSKAPYTSRWSRITLEAF